MFLQQIRHMVEAMIVLALPLIMDLPAPYVKVPARKKSRCTIPVTKANGVRFVKKVRMTYILMCFAMSVVVMER